MSKFTPINRASSMERSKSPVDNGATSTVTDDAASDSKAPAPVGASADLAIYGPDAEAPSFNAGEIKKICALIASLTASPMIDIKKAAALLDNKNPHSVRNRLNVLMKRFNPDFTISTQAPTPADSSPGGDDQAPKGKTKAKKRARAETNKEAEDKDATTGAENTEQPHPPKKQRGRPPKTKKITAAANAESTDAPADKKPHSHPTKAFKSPAAARKAMGLSKAEVKDIGTAVADEVVKTHGKPKAADGGEKEVDKESDKESDDGDTIVIKQPAKSG